MSQTKKRKKKKRRLRYDRLFLFVNIVLILCVLCVSLIYTLVTSLFFQQEPVATATPTPTAEQTEEPTPLPAETVSPQQTADPQILIDEHFTNPSSILFCANKKHPLPTDYVPSDLTNQIDIPKQSADIELRQEAASALENMYRAALNDGVTLYMISGFRSADLQYTLWNGYAAQSGSEYADSISSRAGYSDHQTGLAVDLGALYDDYTMLDKSFADTAAGQWLYNNAHYYGFILRYPQGKQDITGYDFEPWHYRYVGIETATSIYQVSPDETFEEYFNIEGGNYID